MLLIRAVTSSQCGIIHGKSPPTRMASGFGLPLRRIELVNLAALLEDHGAGAGVERLDVEVREPGLLRQLLRADSYDQTLATPSRSEMKYTVSPDHTGSTSFESVHGGVDQIVTS